MSQEQTKVKAGVIKLGLDVHKTKYVVVVQVDGSSPQRAKSMSPDKFLVWIKEQLEQADEVPSCYEAGCFGYSLHRKLVALGVSNLVVRPRSWDEYGHRVKTDETAKRVNETAKRVNSQLSTYMPRRSGCDFESCHLSGKFYVLPV